VFIEIEDLRDEPLEFHHTYGIGELAFERQDAALAQPVVADFVLTHQDRDLHIVGGLGTSLRCRCARCASEFDRRVDNRFDLTYLPQPGGIEEKEEIELRYEEMDVAFYDGVRFDVDLMVTEQVELSLPMRLVCREDCRGLCYRCGQDLNEKDCGCPQEEKDDRLSVLLEFRKKMEQ